MFIHWKVQQIKFQLDVREKNIPREGGEAWDRLLKETVTYSYLEIFKI